MLALNAYVCRFCWNNWTVPIRAALPSVVHLPIIQLLGNNAPLHFKSPQLFAKLYTEWAVKYSFDGFLLDAEVSSAHCCTVHWLKKRAAAVSIMARSKPCVVSRAVSFLVNA